MKSFVFICLAFAIFTTATNAKSVKMDRKQGRHGGNHELHTNPWTVKFDHFAPQDSRTVNFTYTYHLDYFVPNGPLFIYVSDADFFTTEWLDHGLMHDIAHDANAAMITSDNRFFRANLPTENATTANLAHLTVEQTIHDIARLIEVVRSDLNSTNSTVILFGTGYGASLATWTKQRFPHLVHGVWSSSGVYETTVHTAAPYERTSQVIAEIGGQQCSNRLRLAFQQMEVFTFAGDYVYMSQQLGSCYFPVFYFDIDVAAFFAGMAQLVLDYINVNHRQGIVDLCTDLSSNNENEFLAFAQWVRETYRSDEVCLDVSFFGNAYEASLAQWDEIAQLAWNETMDFTYPFVSRPLFYLRCTQLALFPTSVNAESVFGNSIGQDLYFHGCSEVFGPDYDYMLLAETVNRINFQFGGKQPNVSKVILTNGVLDGHFDFGITAGDYRGDDSIVRNIAGYGKSGDLESVSSLDTPQMSNLKQEIRNIILRWSNE